MAKNSHNAGSAGTGVHTIKTNVNVIDKNKPKQKRRNRKHCLNYDRGCKFCKALEISCVGFSNEICPKHNDTTTPNNRSTTGSIDNNGVWHPQHGYGIIISKAGKWTKVRWDKDCKECGYTNKEISEMRKNYKKKSK